MGYKHKEFLKDQFFSNTLQATAQRAGLYRQDSSDEAKGAFRSALKTRLRALVEQYRNGLSEELHLANISGLADELSGVHAEALNGGRFRIGTAQKALNLYLKYWWCAGWIAEPPHCPFDAIILAYVPECRDMRWTKLDSLEDYKRIVHFSKIVAAGRSLSEWELAVYTKIDPAVEERLMEDSAQIKELKKSLGIGPGAVILRDGTRKIPDDNDA